MSAAASPEWISRSYPLLNGDVAQRRFNSGLRLAADRAAFPILIVIAVPLTDADRAIFPIAGEASRFAELEAVVAEHVAGRAVLAGVAADAEAWLFFLYAAQTSWLPGFEDLFRAAAGEHEVGFAVRDDRRWRVFQEYCPQVRSPRRDRIVSVCVIPLLGLTGMRYGAAWAIGGVAANLAWVVPVGWPGWQNSELAARLPEHLSLAFAFITYMFATLFLSLAELLWAPRQPLDALLAAAGLSVVITSVLWPAQRRYYDRMRARAALRAPASPVI